MTISALFRFLAMVAASLLNAAVIISLHQDAVGQQGRTQAKGQDHPTSALAEAQAVVRPQARGG